MTPPSDDVGGRWPTGSLPFSRIAGIAKALVIVQIVTIFLAALVLMTQLSLADEADDLVNDTITTGEFEDASGSFVLSSALAVVAGIATLVLLIIWSYRIAGNLQKMGREPITWKPGLAIVVWLLGGCTLSIINFFMLREHWRGSDPDVAPHDGRWRTGATSPRIVAWFVLGIAQIAVGAVAGLRSLGGVNLGSGTNAFAESLADRLPFVMASSIGAIVSSLLLVLIVRELTTRHMQATREA